MNTIRQLAIIPALILSVVSTAWTQGATASRTDTLLSSGKGFVSLQPTQGKYTICNRVNASGEIVRSELCYDPTIPKEDSAHVWIITTDATGNETNAFIAVGNARDYYKGGGIPPTKAPDSIVFSSNYYCWRYTDCKMRNCIMGNHCSVPAYYLDYGDKYSNRFTKTVRPKLSPEGRIWLDKTFVLLQLATEALVIANADAELDEQAFRKELFDLHPQVYEQSGFFDLSVHDQWIIAMHLDAKDVFSREGRTQIGKIARDYVPYLLHKVVRVSVRRS